MAVSRSEIHLIASRYAVSLFELAEEAKTVPVVTAEMTALKNTLGESEGVLQKLCSPIVAPQQKKEALAAFAKQAGFSELTSRLLKTVAENNRLSLLPDIAAAYVKYAAQASAEVEVEIRSAATLRKETVAAFERALESAYGKKIRIETSVDESLLAGVVIKSGSVMLDSSLKGKLERLEQHLTAATA